MSSATFYEISLINLKSGGPDIYETIFRAARRKTKPGWPPDKENNAAAPKISRKGGLVFR